MPSLAPIASKTAKEERILLPAHFWTGGKAADLELGRTTLDEVERLMPAWPGHGPSEQTQSTPRSERSPWISDETHSALDRIRYSYSPAQTFVAMGFDRKKRLIFVQTQVQEGQAETLLDGISALAPLEEVYRDESTLIRRAQIGDCITADIGAAWRGDESPTVGMVVYLYTCGPGRKR